MPFSAAELNAAIASVPRPVATSYQSWLDRPFSSLQPLPPHRGFRLSRVDAPPLATASLTPEVLFDALSLG
jgi:hypothetical protein